MRKFKFMSKAVVGMMAVAMTMGSLSGVAGMQPMAVYANAGTVTAIVITANGATITDVSGQKNITVAPDATGIAFNATITGGTNATTSWAITENTTNANISIDSSTGVLTLNNATPGTYTVVATSSENNADNQSVTDTVKVNVVSKTVTSVTITSSESGFSNGTISVAKSTITANKTLTFQATVAGSATLEDTDKTVTWKLYTVDNDTETEVSSSETKITLANNVVTLTPNVQVGTYRLKATSTLNDNVKGTADIIITDTSSENENGSVTYTGTTFTVGQAGSATPTVTPATDYAVKSTGAYSVTNGSLPAGLQINANTGVISGSPEANAETATVTVSVITEKNGAADKTITAEVTITINPAGGSDDDDDPDNYSLTYDVNYETMVLTVTADAPYFTVDVLKSESDKAKPSKSYTYPGGNNQVAIDLGFLKIKNENILNIYGSNVTDKTTGGTIVKIAKQPTKEKLTIDASKTSLSDALTGKTTDAAYEYHSTFGSDWDDIAGFDFESAKVAGTTIVVRKAAVTTGSKLAPAGPEVKIKIPASAKAPKVTVDYAKDSIKVTDKMQIALLDGAPITTETAWKTAKKGMTRAEIVNALGILAADASDPFTIVVRTAANGKKSASMPVIVQIKEEPKLTLTTGKTDEATCTIAGVQNKISAAKDKDGVLTFTTSGDFQYEVSGKWKAVPSKGIKNMGDTVKVRLAPKKADKNDAKSGRFASNEVEFTVTKPVEAKVDTVTIADSTESGYTKPAAAKLVAGETTEALVFKFTATAKKGTETVTDATFEWTVTKPTDSQADMSGWTWNNSTLTIARGTELVAGDYTVTAKSEGKTSSPITITIAE